MPDIGMKSIIIIIILFFLALPLAYAQDESSLVYQDHKPGVCPIRIRNDATNTLYRYEVDVSVRTSGNQIIKSYDGTPELPPNFGDYFYGENGCQVLGLSYSNYPSFWDLVSLGKIERVVDSCPTGVQDPTPYDGITNYKCKAYCIPESSICATENTLIKCRSDGSSLETVNCGFKCDSNKCIDTELYVSSLSDKDIYLYGSSVNSTGRFYKPDGTGVAGVVITGQILKAGNVIKELYKYSDSQGYANFIFDNVQLTGDVEIKIKANYRDVLYEKSKFVTFIGEPIKYQVSTYSYVQYNLEPIKYTVELKDTDGKDIYPERLSNLRAVSSITEGNIVINNVEYKGKGLYEISSVTSGAGVYVSKIMFNYGGTEFSSPIIEIDVEKVSLNIDTSDIVPVAQLNEQKTYNFRVFDSFGNKIDPFNAWVVISFPDGTTTRTLTFTEMTKISQGEYKFSFTFPQIEKFTFDLYAEKEGYVRASAKASVAVSGEGEYMAGPTWTAYLIYIIPGGILLFFVLSFVLWRIVKK